MIEQYLPAIVMILVGIGFGVVSAKAHEWLGPRRPTREKLSTYESGMPPVATARERFSVKFYLVAMLFILFDIEVVFMYPWAASFRELGNFALWAMLLFMVTLFVGYVYIVKKGALKWD
jgi:NADH-quinone oxidoreductase subunit A